MDWRAAASDPENVFSHEDACVWKPKFTCSNTAGSEPYRIEGEDAKSRHKNKSSAYCQSNAR